MCVTKGGKLFVEFGGPDADKYEAGCELSVADPGVGVEGDDEPDAHRCAPCK